LSPRPYGPGGWSLAAAQLFQALDPGELHREEPVQKPAVEKANADKYEIREVALD
jgi:hypothetical protein